MGAADDRHAPAGGAQAAPVPPRELIERTGPRRPEQSEQSYIREFYEQARRGRKAAIVDALPDGYSLEGKRVLDFGCGSGRVLRAFLPEAPSGEFWGCDPHRPTIAWLDQHLSPPLHFYVNDRIPTPHPDSYFDLVYAISVFTHITHEWSAWLLELHRILKPDGLLLATIIGPESWGRSLSRPPDENGLGMCLQMLGQRVGDEGSGARVLHSPWWLRSHWGRAFEVLSLRTSGFATGWHGFVLGRKKDVSVTRDDLERPDPDDPRELEAQRGQLLVLEEEAVMMRERWEREQQHWEREQQRANRASPDGQRKLLRAMLGSRAFAVAEQLSRVHKRGRPVFSRQQVRQVLGDEDGPA
jgi:SAM-dependent methyltransferase